MEKSLSAIDCANRFIKKLLLFLQWKNGETYSGNYFMFKLQPSQMFMNGWLVDLCQGDLIGDV